MSGDTTTAPRPPFLLTRDEVVERLLAVIDAHPDNTNPLDVNDEVCLYTDPSDPSRHCLVGQLAADNGWALPPAEMNDDALFAADRCDWPVTEDGAYVLSDAQGLADGRPNGAGRAIPGRWADIRDDVAALASVTPIGGAA